MAGGVQSLPWMEKIKTCENRCRSSAARKQSRAEKGLRLGDSSKGTGEKQADRRLGQDQHPNQWQVRRLNPKFTRVRRLTIIGKRLSRNVTCGRLGVIRRKRAREQPSFRVGAI